MSAIVMRHNDLSDEQLDVQRAYDRSWQAAQETLADPEKRAWLEDGIARVKASDAKPMTDEEFLASTEPTRPAE